MKFVYGFSATLEATQTVVGGGGSGKVTFQPMEVTIPVGPVATEMNQTEVTGAHYSQVTIQLYKPGTTTVAETINARSVSVVALTTADNGAVTSAPLVTVDLAYRSYEDQVQSGGSGQQPVTSSWDLATNKSG